jgi:hypothetical protein
MLLNRQIQVKFVKPSKEATDETTEKTSINVDQITEAVGSTIGTTGVVVVGAISAIKIVDCFCTIAINLTNPANWR